MVSPTRTSDEDRRRLKQNCSVDLSFPYHRQEDPSDVESGAPVSGVIDSTRELENRLSGLFGIECALWFPSGTMAQLVAAQIHMLQTGSHIVALHPTSHLLLHEEDAYRHVLGLEVAALGDWERTVLAGDLPETAGFAFLELPQRHNGGALPTWVELQAIKRKAVSAGQPLHIDGARIWGCRPFYDNRSYAEIIAGCTSVYVSLYKDLGASSGAVLLGSKAFIDEARIWRVRHGGALANSKPQATEALRGLDRHLPKMESYVESAIRIAEAIARKADRSIKPFPPHTNIFRMALPFDCEEAEERRDLIAASHGLWLAESFWPAASGVGCELEITVGEIASQADPDVIANAIATLVDIRATH